VWQHRLSTFDNHDNGVDWLGPQYTIIGEVTTGLDTLELIAAVPLGSSPASPDPTPSAPLESVYIVSVSVER
jgi:cyclophilin family peptidyl-prolyl cis-trans isomerase